MKINKILLENFASYKKEILDLDKIGQVINIFGSTGSGKTTLIVDSITFCLFGNAYGIDRQGTTKLVINPKFNEAKCEIELTLGNKKYKITRIAYKDKSAQAILYEEKNGEFIKKAVNVSEIDKFIKELLKFDYETFLNSIMIRQGDVVHFLEADAKKRREILLKAFNLDFKNFLEISKELRNKKENEIRKLTEKIDELNKIVSNENQLKLELNNNIIKLNELTQKIKRIEEEREEIEKEINNISKNKSELQSKLSYLIQKENEMNKKYSYLNELLNNKNIIEEKLIKENDIKRKLNKLKIDKSKLDDIEKIINNINNNKKEIETLNKIISKIKNRLNDIEQYKSRLANIENKQKEIAGFYSKQFDLEQEIESLKTKINTLEAEKANYLRVLDLIENQKSNVCPVCKRELDKEHRDGLISDHRNIISKIENELSELNRRLAWLKEKKERYDEIIKGIEKEANETVINLLKKEISEEENLRKELETEIIKLNDLQNENKKLLENLSLSLYKNEDLGKIKKEIEEEIGALNKELGSIDALKNQLPNLEMQIKNLNDEIQKIKSEIQDKDEIKRKIDEIKQYEDELKAIKEILDKEYKDTNQNLGIIKNSIDNLREKLKEIEDAKNELEINKKELSKQDIEYKALKIICDDIFNDRGFPLKLLKDYLNRLNEYISYYFLPKVKPDISVDIKAAEEKIEINISQNSYTRELATYSGGEKTIIGLAFRLGIAKILSTYRVGVAPKMLVIDEGFGPLSKEFREAVLKTILELKHDYEKIFIISHVEDIQENPMFDSIIKVWKDIDGFSHFEIIK